MRRGAVLSLLALCGLSAMLGYRAARMTPPDPSAILAALAEAYEQETGRAHPCEGRPLGKGYVFTCGFGEDKVTFHTDAYGRLIERTTRDTAL